MSLVRTRPSRQRIAGALFLALVVGGVTAVLWLSGRTLGPGVHFTVEVKRTGALRPKARIKLAGRDVGEVRGMVFDRPRPGAEREPRHVLLQCFVAAPWSEEVRDNSEFFVATPSILGEAWLEIAPPREAARGARIASGARLRGSDPPALDEMIPRIYHGIEDIAALLRVHRPALDQLIFAAARLSSTLDEVGLGDAHFGELSDRVHAALDDARAVAAALDESDVGTHAASAGKAWSALESEGGPQFRALGQEADRIAQILEASGEFVPANQRAAVAQAIEKLRAAAQAGESIAQVVDEMAAMVERGEGTMGGLLADKELFDDLHETHRILKNQAWRLLIKPGTGSPTSRH